MMRMIGGEAKAFIVFLMEPMIASLTVFCQPTFHALGDVILWATAGSFYRCLSSPERFYLPGDSRNLQRMVRLTNHPVSFWSSNLDSGFFRGNMIVSYQHSA